VDYARRAALLGEIKAAARDAAGTLDLFQRFASSPTDDRFKLAVTHRLLDFRRAHAELFQHGDYEPLTFAGGRSDHAFGFARRHAGREVLVIVPRLIAALIPDANAAPLGDKVWGDTIVRLPRGRDSFSTASESRVNPDALAEAADGGADSGASYVNALTGERTATRDGAMRLADVFAHAPVAMLHSPGHE